MKKLILTLFLAFIMCFSFACNKENSETQQNKELPATTDLIYECYIASGQFVGTEENIVIPEKMEGMTVIGIGENAFKDNTYVKTIVIPITVKKIEKDAFKNCINLTEIYYYGVNSDWQQIEIDTGNDILASEIICFYSESQPANEDYKYWHIVNGVPTVWPPPTPPINDGDYTPYY